jgi:DNA repair protein RadC
VGTLTTSLVHPREVFRSAVREAAAALIAVHNHPSGDPEPSAEDLEVTRRLIEAGRLLGIPLLDHVVVGDGAWVSLRERMPFGPIAGGFG